MPQHSSSYIVLLSVGFDSDAPKYAAQPTACVTLIPEEVKERGDGCPFSVFVMRCIGSQPTLGWEYCGDYVVHQPDIEAFPLARSVTPDCKSAILHDIKHSLRREKGEWHYWLDYWQDIIMSKCERDPTLPGTALMRAVNEEPEPDDSGDEREERLERERREKATDAAKARALGLDKLSKQIHDATLALESSATTVNKEKLLGAEMAFAEKLICYDDFYGTVAIKFHSYDEEVYNYVKAGETTKNKHNKKRAKGEECAKASDWYNIYDQRVEGCNNGSTKKRKGSGMKGSESVKKMKEPMESEKE